MEELHLIGPDHAGGYKEPFQARLQKDEMAKRLRIYGEASAFNHDGAQWLLQLPAVSAGIYRIM